MGKVIMKQGEAKVVTLTVTDEAGALVNLSAATLTLGVKAHASDLLFVIQKANTDFDKTAAASGVVKVPLTATDTNLAPGDYVGELKAEWASSPVVIEKTINFYLQIRQAVIPAL
jgi:hypothetical protein